MSLWAGVGTGRHPILVFDHHSKFLRAFGDGIFASAHGLRVDASDNIWVTDNANHTVIKFSHDGKVLMTLGEKNVAGEDADHFNKPTDIAFAPNGDFYIADGYGNSRVVKFNKEGKFLMAWARRARVGASLICLTRFNWMPRDMFMWATARMIASRSLARTGSFSGNSEVTLRSD